MDLGLRGKVALVAASSRGLGRATAEELAAEGAHLVMCARSEGPLREAAAAIERGNPGVRVVALPADLADPDAVDRVVGGARRGGGRGGRRGRRGGGLGRRVAGVISGRMSMPRRSW
jgi:3-oxoacyl-[acyl-carrier protein] reductase